MKILQAVLEIWSGHDFGQTDRRTDRQTDRQTDAKDKNNISPLYTGGDIITYIHNVSLSCEEINIVTSSSYFNMTFYRFMKKTTLLISLHILI